MKKIINKESAFKLSKSNMALKQDNDINITRESDLYKFIHDEIGESLNVEESVNICIRFTSKNGKEEKLYFTHKNLRNLYIRSIENRSQNRVSIRIGQLFSHLFFILGVLGSNIEGKVNVQLEGQKVTQIEFDVSKDNFIINSNEIPFDKRILSTDKDKIVYIYNKIMDSGESFGFSYDICKILNEKKVFNSYLYELVFVEYINIIKGNSNDKSKVMEAYKIVKAYNDFQFNFLYLLDTQVKSDVLQLNYTKHYCQYFYLKFNVDNVNYLEQIVEIFTKEKITNNTTCAKKENKNDNELIDKSFIVEVYEEVGKYKRYKNNFNVLFGEIQAQIKNNSTEEKNNEKYKINNSEDQQAEIVSIDGIEINILPSQYTKKYKIKEKAYDANELNNVLINEIREVKNVQINKEKIETNLQSSLEDIDIILSKIIINLQNKDLDGNTITFESYGKEIILNTDKSHVFAIIGENGCGKTRALKGISRRWKDSEMLEHFVYKCKQNNVYIENTVYISADDIVKDVKYTNANKIFNESYFKAFEDEEENITAFFKWCENNNKIKELFQNIAFESENGYQEFIKFYDTASAGEKMILNVLYIVYQTSQNTLLLLDEIEVHLHPKMIHNLMDIIKEHSLKNNYYILLATHSLHVIQNLARESIIYYKNNSNGGQFVICEFDTYRQSYDHLENFVFNGNYYTSVNNRSDQNV